MEQENLVEALPAPKKEIFGEDFAYLAITATVVTTYSIINSLFLIV